MNLKKALIILWLLLPIIGISQATNIDSIINKSISTDYKNPNIRGLIHDTIICTDDSLRDFSFYIPQNYNPNNETPLFVYLHGGVGRNDLVDSITWLEYLNKLPWMKMSEETGYICLFPKGEFSAMWWDTVGSFNILNQIKLIKGKFNIDDNRVYLCGFSDGASATWYFAMQYPTMFAGYIPLNGHPGVGSSSGGFQCYLPTLYNKNIYAINTEKDGLYPDKKIRPLIKVMYEGGANNLSYKSFNGIGHRFDYLDSELDEIILFMENHSRNHIPKSIVIETSDHKYAESFWFKINETDSNKIKEWHGDFNPEMMDDRLTFGFIADQNFKENGVKINKLSGTNNLFSTIDILEGDIITQLDDSVISNMSDFSVYAQTKKRGDSCIVKVKRKNEELIFAGKFPDPIKYPLYERKEPPVYVKATNIANDFYIESSGVKSFTIYLHPEMIQMDQKVYVFVNNELVFEDYVEMDLNYLENEIETKTDKSLIYFNEIIIALDEQL
jgi:predicted esterase